VITLSWLAIVAARDTRKSPAVPARCRLRFARYGGAVRPPARLKLATAISASPRSSPETSLPSRPSGAWPTATRTTHLLITDRAFRLDGTFLHLGFHEFDVLIEAFRRAVLREFVHQERFSPDAAGSMLAWPHSGFHVHHGVRLEADDLHGILQLARYASRAPIPPRAPPVRSEPAPGPARLRPARGPTSGSHDFPAPEFLTILLAHVPIPMR
jgi:hypothetical protein